MFEKSELEVIMALCNTELAFLGIVEAHGIKTEQQAAQVAVLKAKAARLLATPHPEAAPIEEKKG